ncbi:PPE domain-containing protein, partial [Actinosynnema pretiosum]|uniref:PPE domain-containing protein n=1 Tax=Actinosynnema pretiosum TaxID=42197 RepID=UPI0031D8E1F8
MSDHRWRGYDHPELYNMINSGPGPSASYVVEDGWQRLDTALQAIDADLRDGLAGLNASWEGDTADSTQTAVSPLAQWTQDAQQSARTMKSSAGLQADYIADARKEMPEPVPITTEAPSGWDKFKAGFTDGVTLGLAGSSADVIRQQRDHEAQEAAQENAQQKAIAVMKSYESNSEWNRNTLGEFVPPPQVVIDAPLPSGASGIQSTATAGYASRSDWSVTSGGGTTGTSSYTPTPTAPPVSIGGYTPVGTGGGTTNTSWATPTPVSPPVTPPVTPPGLGTTTPSGGGNPGGGGGTWTMPNPVGNGGGNTGANPPRTNPNLGGARPPVLPTGTSQGGNAPKLPGAPGVPNAFGRPGMPGGPGGLGGGRPGMPGMPGMGGFGAAGGGAGGAGMPSGTGAAGVAGNGQPRLGRGGAAGIQGFGPG